MTQKILLAGDSWACGEWSALDRDQLELSNLPLINHAGLYQYIQDHTSAVVASVADGAQSNSSQLARIRQYISNHTVDLIIWFQTDPLRDCVNCCNPQEFWQDKSRLDLFLLAEQQYIHATYGALNDLGIPVYCIGGCWPLANLDAYSRLIPVIPSVIAFLCDQDPQPLPLSVLCPQWSMRHVPGDPALVEYLTEQFSSLDRWKMLLATESSQASKYFIPDGCHPNRLGHLRIFDHLVNLGLLKRNK
jgi:hypothetical protein